MLPSGLIRLPNSNSFLVCSTSYWRPVKASALLAEHCQYGQKVPKQLNRPFTLAVEPAFLSAVSVSTLFILIPPIKILHTEPVIRLNSDQAAKLVAVPELKDRPQSVAYKTVNVTFQPTGEPRPRDRVALLNALQEVLVLTHRPIALHPYIINFLGLAWSKVQGTSQQVPVLITEYAEHGTLANVLSRERLHGKAKRRLCLDIALGIQCLHQCGIVHGDVKLENILVTTSENRAFVAKLADFGFATLGDEWPSFLAGTWLWAAPEVALGKVSVPKLTDVFSYGLLVWSIAIDGQSPFGLLQERSSHRSLSRATIKALKQTDDLLGLAKQPMWRNEAK